MKKLIMICALTVLAEAPARAVTDTDLSGEILSTDTVKADEAAEIEEAQADIQESDEDLAGFVQDYIKKDTTLKGAFFLEETGSGKTLKLNLDTVLKKTTPGPDNSKIVEAVFKDAAGKKRAILFRLQSAGFGGIDILKIEFKKEEKPYRSGKAKK
jgi:hypothetical protein